MLATPFWSLQFSLESKRNDRTVDMLASKHVTYEFIPVAVRVFG